MKSLPASLILEKNLLSNTSPWYLLLDVILPAPADPLYFICNTDELVFQGNTYTPFPFKIGVTKHTSKGEIPSVQFQVCNINRVMQTYIELYDGLIGCEVISYLVHADNLVESYAELTLTFEILSCHTDAEWATFDCGAPNPMRKRFPLYRYIGNHCNWKYGSAECGLSIAPITGTGVGGGASMYDTSKSWAPDSLIGETIVDSTLTPFVIVDNGSTYVMVDGSIASGTYTITTTCDRTISSCQAKKNSNRFGGYKGLTAGGIRLA